MITLIVEGVKNVYVELSFLVGALALWMTSLHFKQFVGKEYQLNPFIFDNFYIDHNFFLATAVHCFYSGGANQVMTSRYGRHFLNIYLLHSI